MKPTREPEQEDMMLVIEVATYSMIVGGGLIYQLLLGLMKLV